MDGKTASVKRRKKKRAARKTRIKRHGRSRGNKINRAYVADGFDKRGKILTTCAAAAAMEKLEKLVRADNAQDYRTFCREIGPSEGLLRQSDYGGRRVSMEKKRGERKKGGRKTKNTHTQKQRERERKGKKSAIPNNGVESTGVERGIRWGRVFPG